MNKKSMVTSKAQLEEILQVVLADYRNGLCFLDATKAQERAISRLLERVDENFPLPLIFHS